MKYIMTTHDKFRFDIARSQTLHRFGAMTTLCGFMLLILAAPSHANGGWLWPIIQVATAIGFGTGVYSILRLRKVIKCPSCGKPLNYFLIDFSYSKKLLIFGIPDDLPGNVTACPYCHEYFGK